MMNYWSCSALIFLFSMLSACSVGPRYQAPMASTPLVWHAAPGSEKASTLNGWWCAFQDPLLNALIEQGAVSNFSVKMAKARVEFARAEYAVAFAQLFPALNANALPPTGTGVDLTQVLAASATLEPDIFGKQRQNRVRAKAHLEEETAAIKGIDMMK